MNSLKFTLLFTASMGISLPNGRAQNPNINQQWWLRPNVSYISTPSESMKEWVGPFVVGHPSFQDEGRGLFLRRVGINQERQSIQEARKRNRPLLAYIDSLGMTREIALGVRFTEPGKLEKTTTGQTKIYASVWSWDEKGPTGKSPQINGVVWAGLSEMINNSFDWQEKVDTDLGSQGLEKPKYPNKNLASGFLKESTLPSDSKFYDALGGRDIFDRISTFLAPKDDASNILPEFEISNGKTRSGHLRFPKDAASPWWTEYNLSVAKQFLLQGVNGFWLDSASGLQFIGLKPVELAFGRWTREMFAEFLGSRKMKKVDVQNYVISVSQVLDRSFSPQEKDLNHRVFKNPHWATDSTWLSFLGFKAQTAQLRAAELYKGIKLIASQVGKDPDSIMVAGTDPSVYPFASSTGEELDQIHTRYSPNMSPELGTLGRGLLPRGSNGPFYAITSSYTKSPFSHIWYLHPEQETLFGDTREKLAPVLTAEALANNALLVGDDVNTRFALTDEQGLKLAKVMRKISPVFQGRERYARVAILYSPSTLMMNLAPGGFLGSDDEVPPKAETEPSVLHHGMAVQGWSELLESMNLPYKIIPEFKLSAKELNGIQVLIIPHVVSLDRDQALPTLKSYLDNVGTVVITGNRLGERATAKRLFSAQPNALQELRASISQERLIVMS